MVKNLPAIQETRVQSLGQKEPLEKGMATHSSVHGKAHGQRSLEGYSPWDPKESDVTEQHTHTHTHTHAHAHAACYVSQKRNSHRPCQTRWL